MDEDDEPELAGYEPHDEKPLRSPHLATIMRVVVVLGLIALVLPGILVTATTADRTANASCASIVSYYAPEARDFTVRFEFFSPAGIGWNCYAIMFGGDERMVEALGLIPGGPGLPKAPLERS